MSKTGLFIGRFQPFHYGHLAAMKFALRKVETVVVVIGSAQKSHEPKNPFTAGERVRMIKETIDADTEIDARRILIIPVPDVDVHSLWTCQVDMLVPHYDLVITNDPFTLMLFRKHGTKTIRAPLYRRHEMTATEIRKKIAKGDSKWNSLVPRPVAIIVREIDGIQRVKAIAESNHDHN